MSPTDLAPPPLDPIAAQRWQNLKTPLTSRPSAAIPSKGAAISPWLHEEVGRRMAERLQWITLRPDAWLDWAPARGGLATHQQVQALYPAAQAWVHEPASVRRLQTENALRPTEGPSQRGGALQWLSFFKGFTKGFNKNTSQPALKPGFEPIFGLPAPQSMGMVWANMGLHTTAEPGQWLSTWHQALKTDGFLMFSCLGPDTLIELRALYEKLGWPAPAQAFTDMHDWGDMLVEAGFAEPVMDMERIVLTFETPERLLQELRELGRNLNPQRFGACRGRQWKAELLQEIKASEASRPLQLTFEVIYGHAMKPLPRNKMTAESVISLDDMKASLRQHQGLKG